MIKLLEEIDELLTFLEDTAHGEEGKRITEMRYKILTELSNSHKHGVMQAEGSDDAKGAAVGQRSVGTVAAGGDKCSCPDDQCQLGDHPTCRWKEYYARKSPEGQP